MFEMDMFIYVHMYTHRPPCTHNYTDRTETGRWVWYKKTCCWFRFQLCMRCEKGWALITVPDHVHVTTTAPNTTSVSPKTALVLCQTVMEWLRMAPGHLQCWVILLSRWRQPMTPCVEALWSAINSIQRCLTCCISKPGGLTPYWETLLLYVQLDKYCPYQSTFIIIYWSW